MTKSTENSISIDISDAAIVKLDRLSKTHIGSLGTHCADMHCADIHCADIHCADIHCADIHCSDIKS